MSSRHGGLTKQQIKIVSFLMEGLTNREIGLHLGITEKTVKSHITFMLRKLKLKSRAQIVAWEHKKTTGRCSLCKDKLPIGQRGD